MPRDMTQLILNLNIDAIKLQVMRVLDDRNDELKHIVESEINDFKENIEDTIRNQVRLVIASAIEVAIQSQKFRLAKEIEAVVEERFSEIINGIRR